ncbi:hypothetical protein BDY21DRAFT_157682 [Lineolata rhizophorae]|uniref:Uncharacterized protein n=1 Tax=Lineolata rhizophorae TaxID=578093 RepID=A0A6A6NLK1_9PEZI|nr:hypothetical protein BDY21DRAFT_157682 [Lineolata rhizophorae]
MNYVVVQSRREEPLGRPKYCDRSRHVHWACMCILVAFICISPPVAQARPAGPGLETPEKKRQRLCWTTNRVLPRTHRHASFRVSLPSSEAAGLNPHVTIASLVANRPAYRLLKPARSSRAPAQPNWFFFRFPRTHTD